MTKSRTRKLSEITRQSSGFDDYGDETENYEENTPTKGKPPKAYKKKMYSTNELALTLDSVSTDNNNAIDTIIHLLSGVASDICATPESNTVSEDEYNVTELKINQRLNITHNNLRDQRIKLDRIICFIRKNILGDYREDSAN